MPKKKERKIPTKKASQKVVSKRSQAKSPLKQTKTSHRTTGAHRLALAKTSTLKKTNLPKTSQPRLRTRKTKTLRKSLRHISLRTKMLFIIGILLLIAPISFYANETIQLAFFTPQVPIIAKKYPVPTHISIPAVQVDLPIQEEAINRGAWGIADNAISHLNTSARPLEDGPIILYGHNTNDRFGPIRWLSKGQEIILTTADRKMHKYTIIKTEDVSPNQVNLLNNVKTETLILYTCDGFADLQRFLVFARPK